MSPDVPARFDAPALWRAMQRAEALYIDVRTQAEFAAGHAPGAIHLPLYEETTSGRQLRGDFVAEARKIRVSAPPTTVLVMACRTGARSRQAVQVLQASGVDRVADFPGGWDGRVDSWGRVTAMGWSAAALPIESD